jgi:fructose-bisphosphate aldolase class II
MPLVTSKKMFEKAYKGGYAIGAFNINNMESAQAIVEAGKQTRSPLIIQVSQGARKYANPIYLKKMLEAAVLDSDLPIVMHLDHGSDFEQCKNAIEFGFTSVMIDASALPFKENIAATKKVVDYAHDKGVVVEAELGKLSGIEDHVNVTDKDASFTNPDEVREFVQKTKVDSLAIAIGTSHGAYKFKGEAMLRFDILEKISGLLPDFPIVLHGASSVPQELVAIINKFGGSMPNAKGVPEEMIRRAASMAVCKVNIDSDLRVAATAAVRQTLFEHPDYFDPRQYNGPAREAMKQMVIHKITDVLGSNNKA